MLEHRVLLDCLHIVESRKVAPERAWCDECNRFQLIGHVIEERCQTRCLRCTYSRYGRRSEAESRAARHHRSTGHPTVVRWEGAAEPLRSFGDAPPVSVAVLASDPTPDPYAGDPPY